MSEKRYIQINLEDHTEILTNHILTYNDQEYLVPDSIVEDISKQSGVSNTMRKILNQNHPTLLISNIVAGFEYYYKGNIIFLLEDGEIIQSSYNKYIPLLNSEFFDTMSSFLEDYQDIVHIDSSSEEDLVAEMVVYPKEDFEYNNRRYNLGVVFENDELNSITCRMVCITDDLKFYLPTKYFNLSAGRYMRTSVDMKEALKQLLLRVLESMSDRKEWFSIVSEISDNLNHCAEVPATYEEYKKVLRVLNHITVQSDMDEMDYDNVKSPLEEHFLEDFLSDYPSLDDKKNSYIWRCSAVGNRSILDLVGFLNQWRLSKLFYEKCNNYIMNSIGDFLMFDRISENLAKRKK